MEGRRHRGPLSGSLECVHRGDFVAGRTTQAPGVWEINGAGGSAAGTSRCDCRGLLDTGQETIAAHQNTRTAHDLGARADGRGQTDGETKHVRAGGWSYGGWVDGYGVLGT